MVKRQKCHFHVVRIRAGVIMGARVMAGAKELVGIGLQQGIGLG